MFFSLVLCALWEICQVEGRKSGLQKGLSNRIVVYHMAD